MDALVQTYENSMAKNLIDAEGRCNEAIEYINNGNTYVGLIGLKNIFYVGQSLLRHSTYIMSDILIVVMIVYIK